MDADLDADIIKPRWWAPATNTTASVDKHRDRATYMREWRWRTRRSLPKEQWLAERRASRQHGSENMYRNQGCRCELCKAWNRGFSAGYRRRRQEAK